MKADNPFDRKLEVLKGRAPAGVVDGAIFVVDTLDLCIAAAETLFEEKTTPELALAIYDRIVPRIPKG